VVGLAIDIPTHLILNTRFHHAANLNIISILKLSLSLSLLLLLFLLFFF
jgi:hypothetical protein